MGNVFLVSSEQGDIGKTIIGIKTGIELANRGKKVLLVDLSKGNKKVAEYLNVNEDIIYDIKDVLDSTCSMEQSIIDISDNLSVLPYPRITNKLDNIKRDSFTYLINEAKNKFDVTIVDVDCLSSCHYIDFCHIEGIIIINNNDFSAVKEINNAADIVEKFEIKKIMVIINKFNKKNANKGIMLRIKDIKKLIEQDILGTIEDELKYVNLDYDFLYNKDINSFNNTIDLIVNKIYQ